VNRARLRVLAVVAEEDAPLLAGIDAPVPHVPPEFSVHGELSLFADAGLSPYQALRARDRRRRALPGRGLDLGDDRPGPPG
jgi:hypothetical protein